MRAESVAAHMSKCADGGKDETTNQSWHVVAVPFKLRSDKEKHHWEDLRPSASSLAWLAWQGPSETEMETSERDMIDFFVSVINVTTVSKHANLQCESGKLAVMYKQQFDAY